MLPVGCARAVHGFLGRNIAQCSQLWMHSSAADSLYTTLGVHHAATDAEIKRAFRQVCRVYKPPRLLSRDLRRTAAALSPQNSFPPPSFPPPPLGIMAAARLCWAEAPRLVVMMWWQVQAAKKWHPDLHGTSDEARLRFGQCLLAYQVLSEPEARRSYDLSQDGQHPAALRAASKLMAFRYAPQPRGCALRR